MQKQYIKWVILKNFVIVFSKNNGNRLERLQNICFSLEDFVYIA